MIVFSLALALVGVHSASQDGFLAFFTAACPKGWSSLSLLEGRLLLLSNTSYQAGEPFGFPLTDGEDRGHTHIVSGNFNLPSHEVSALGGSDSVAAHSGAQPLLGFLNTTSPSPSGLPFLQLTACRYNSISFTPAPALPPGGVALWDPAAAPSTGCPAGSAPLQGGAGYLLSVSNATGLRTSSAAPLEPGKDIDHSHGFAASLHLDEVKFLGIGGCCDNDAAADGDHGASGMSSSASLNLPYASILACNVSAGIAVPVLPAGAVLLTVDGGGCPAGWVPLSGAFAGRMVVGTPAFGVPSRTWGGAAFPQSGPAWPDHEHSFVLDFSTYAAGIELASGSGAGGYGRNADVHTVGGTTGGAVGAAQQLPVVGILGCVVAAA